MNAFAHVLINNTDTKAKCRHLKKWHLKGLCGRCLSKFIDRRYSQSCWYFRPSFVNCCPLPFSLSQLYPFPMWISIKYTVYKYTVCKGGGVWGSRPQTDNTCLKVPLQVNFFRWQLFAQSFMSLIFLRSCSKKLWPLLTHILARTLVFFDKILWKLRFLLSSSEYILLQSAGLSWKELAAVRAQRDIEIEVQKEDWDR